MDALIWSVVGALLAVLGVAFLGSVVAWIVTARHVERDERADMVKALLAPDALDTLPDEIDREWADVELWMRDLDEELTPEQRARQIFALKVLYRANP